jgi:hypothetical protein
VCWTFKTKRRNNFDFGSNRVFLVKIINNVTLWINGGVWILCNYNDIFEKWMINLLACALLRWSSAVYDRSAWYLIIFIAYLLPILFIMWNPRAHGHGKIFVILFEACSVWDLTQKNVSLEVNLWDHRINSDI